MLSVDVAESLYLKAQTRWPKDEGRPDSDDFCLAAGCGGFPVRARLRQISHLSLRDHPFAWW